VKKILGIDEAGRGPVLGDLFIGAVLCKPDQIKILEQNGVKDSKKLSKIKRRDLYVLITKNCINYLVKRISVETIDNNIKLASKKNLNILEKEVMCEIIEEMQPDEVYIDAISNNPKKFRSEIIDYLNSKRKLLKVPIIIAENKADSAYIIVGAASIIAKVERDNSINLYRKEYEMYGNIGSGYPSDKYTIEFLKNYIKKEHELPKIARKSWETSINLMNEIIQQRKIDDC